MSSNQAFDTFSGFLNFQIAEFNRKRRDNRAKARGAKILAALFGAATTVLLGIHADAEYQEFLKHIALLLSAVVTVIATWEALFDHRSLWVRYSQTVFELTMIQADLDHLKATAPEDLTQLQALRKRADDCLTTTNHWWMELRTTASGK